MARREGKVSELSRCLPGDRLAVWYSDDSMYHERILIWRGKSSEGSWYILTPDLDLYEESYDDPSDGPHHFKIKGIDFKYYSRLPSAIYRFSEDLSADDMKKYIIQALDEMSLKEFGPGEWLPSYVKVGGKEVSTSGLLGNRVVTRRLVRGGGQVEHPQGPMVLVESLDSSVKELVVAIGPAPDSHVWMHFPAKHEDGLAKEVVVSKGRGVRTGEEQGLYWENGRWLHLQLVKIEEAPELMERYSRGLDHDLAVRLGLPSHDDVRAKEEETKKKGEAEPENPDARVLEVDYDAQGERYKEWRQVALEAKEYTFQDWPLDGPLTTGHLIKHFSKFGGDPKRWLADWMRSKQIHENDRISFEMKVLIESLYLAGTYDQLNMSCLASVEVISRRVQAVVDAYSVGPIPDWGAAKVMTLYRSPEDAISPQLRSWAARKNKEELELFQSRAKYREGRKGLVVEEASASAVADGSLPGAAKAKAKAKKGGGKGLEAPPSA